MTIDERLEWLETDGRGGFASGTATGIRTRRYHALLLPATTPPTGRMVLMSGFDVTLECPAGAIALSSQRYAPDVVHPDGVTRLERFVREPWPTWDYRVDETTRVRHEVFIDRLSGATVVSWRVEGTSSAMTLRVRPFVAARDYHALQHENGAFDFTPDVQGQLVVFRPYAGVPAVACASNGAFRPSPDWYRRFFYTQEAERGLDAVEDLASPGEWTFALSVDAPAAMILGAEPEPLRRLTERSVLSAVQACRHRETARRSGSADPLDRAADAYIVERGRGRTIVAGYPWFTDWGRDTFIALRGLCLATTRLDTAKAILLEWADAVSEGMLPNRFADHGESPEFNSVDASLWYVVAVEDFLREARGRRGLLSALERRRLTSAALAIVEGYAAGTRFGIRMDRDALLAAGVRGQQLTWMDARVGDREITPRIGKPVEIQALWLNVLAFAATLDRKWRDPTADAQQMFVRRFWDKDRGYLADVVDVDHVPDRTDDTFRPNQILAVGGLPRAIVPPAVAQAVVAAVEARLVTPLGLRSLAPDATGYAGHYGGAPWMRDAVYHQGTVWPWLVGPFVDAWLRVRHRSDEAKRHARERFVQPLLDHLETAGLGHVSEIADGDAPFTPRGCPFQAWSLGELLRARRMTEIVPARARKSGAVTLAIA